ncbi:hypothetical protein HII28_02095 [Planctomonas sp. JC2975]|uniref:hypothetical protein n=1 Tax=Planctomonas sp. JC2975 TaxID=2729626 RepID=UPI0014740F7B|nr:hypothetical protein [Planctomonas sp. JC2975]NNC10678.1 hypothetical protein [Planctomonas sp. JC2975]
MTNTKPERGPTGVMSYLECITNELEGVRSCTVKDEHRDNCQYEQCGGCLPQPSRVGLLCLRCWRRLEVTLAEWYLAENVIASHTTLISHDNAGVHGHQDGYVNLPMTTLAVDEVRSYLRGAPAEAEAWVSSTSGATNAVRFSICAERALRAFPIQERERPLRRMRCPNPVHGAYPPIVQWIPPQAFADPITVRCICGWEQSDQDKIDDILAIEAIH